jgi:hypothetical protein
MRKLWQRNYYEHFIRNADDYTCIADYIVVNPARWQMRHCLMVEWKNFSCFFFNKGTTIADAGVLSMMNNALIPAGNYYIVIWNRVENNITLVVGTAVIIMSLLFHARCNKLTQTFKERNA